MFGARVPLQADRCIDGNWYTSANCNKGHSTTCHTNVESSPWLALDLGAPLQIQGVAVYNRRDCCQYRLGAFEVWVGSSLDSRLEQLCASATADASYGPFVVECLATGRVVTILVPRTTSLNLAEVKVYSAFQPPPPSLPPFAPGQAPLPPPPSPPPSPPVPLPCPLLGPYNDRYLSGYCSPTVSAASLYEAAVQVMAHDSCSGVTYEPNQASYTGRTGTALRNSSTGEVSWLIDCAPRQPPPPSLPSPLSPPPSPPPIPFHGYAWQSNPSTYAEHRAACTSLGGRLAIPRSASDMAELLAARGASVAFYIGVDDADADGVYTTGDGVDVTGSVYSNWKSGEPKTGQGSRYAIVLDHGKWSTSAGHYKRPAMQLA